MCVICVAAKKRHMKREEVLQAIKANSAGFFGFTVHDGERRTVRTLDEKEFMAFFDSVADDDVWAMHARIPSRGGTKLENVHGWEQDGIIFCHNMTLSQLDGMMKDAKWEGTDSEFFFRHVFIPFYRGCGKDAYKDGKFCPDLDAIVRHFCGTSNKFMFIMPDDRMVRYGYWVEEKDRKEGGETAFFASNSSYKVFDAAWRPTALPHGGRVVTGYFDDGCDPEYIRHCGCGYECDSLGLPTTPTRNLPREDVGAAEVAMRVAGVRRMCQAALLNLVVEGVRQYRAAMTELYPSETESDLCANVDDIVEDMAPRAFTAATYEAAVDGLAGLAGGTMGPAVFARRYADEIGPQLARGNAGVTPYFPSEANVREGLSILIREFEVFRRVAGVAVDFGARTPASFVCAVDLPTKEDGRWKVRKIRTEDILVDESMAPDVALKGVSVLLEFLASSGKEKVAS